MIKRIGSIIQSRAQLHESQIEEAAQEAKRQGFRLGDILLKKGLFTEREFFEALADQFSMEFIPDIKNLISTELLRELPSDIFKNG